MRAFEVGTFLLAFPLVFDVWADRVQVGYKIWKESNRCNVDSDCRNYDQRCVRGSCGCPDGDFYSNEQRRCYRRIQGSNDNCDVTEQCARYAPGSFCNTYNRKCDCPANNWLQTSPTPKCVSQGDRNTERCNTDNDCHDSQKTCVGGFCSCPRGMYTDQSGRCFRESGNDNWCNSDRDCKITDQICMPGSGTCKCPPGTVFADTKSRCFKQVVSSGNFCQAQEQCDDFLLGTICKWDHCCIPNDLNIQTWRVSKCDNGQVSSKYGNVFLILVVASVVLSVS